MMMETARSSETLVNFYQITRRYNPEDSITVEVVDVGRIKQKVVLRGRNYSIYKYNNGAGNVKFTAVEIASPIILLIGFAFLYRPYTQG
jgi:hypothetical protein